MAAGHMGTVILIYSEAIGRAIKISLSDLSVLVTTRFAGLTAK